MTKKTIKKALPVVIGTLVIALTTPIIPANLYVEASKGAKVSNSKSQDKKAAEKKASKKKNVDKKTIDKVKSENYISLEKAIEIAMKRVDKKKLKVTDYEIVLTYDDPHYLVEITTTNNSKVYEVYNIKVDGITGEIEDVKVEKIKGEHKSKTNNGRFISKYEAKMTALKEVKDKQAFITGFEIELEKKIPHYLIEVKTFEYKYLIKVNAENKEVFELTKDVRDKDDKDTYYDHEYKVKGNSDKIKKDNKNKKTVVDVKYITEKEAIKIALDKIGRDVKVKEIEFDKDDNPPKYEIEMYNKDYSYEIEVHAITGSILKFERDKD
ncbi:PepSY domain-containing protein [Tissierella sp.]|uniref:PepSY domain-containing protein n=1 Tax=Tissierella sp. TaxID=41274 RepID=UPI0028A70007|nr:PepSY domain-containing protein [Tissierella sp.]